jgi:hypothetical protein
MQGLMWLIFLNTMMGVKQIGDVLHKAMDNGTFVVNEKDAFLARSSS